MEKLERELVICPALSYLLRTMELITTEGGMARANAEVLFL